MTHGTIRSYIDKQANNYSNNTYIIDPVTDKKITFGSLRDNARNIAQYLHNEGYEKGASIAFAGFNHSDLVQTILGLLYGGFRVVSINLVAGKGVISHIVSHSESVLIICDDSNYDMMASIIAEQDNALNIISISELLRVSNQTPHYEIADYALHPNDDGLLIYTSGTTGKPKGVVLSHANLLAGGSNTVNAHQLMPHDKALCSLPLYHINAFCVSMMACLISGQIMVVPYKFSARDFWPLIYKYQCTWFSLVPTQISYILHHSSNKIFDSTLSTSIRFGRSASSALAPALQKDFEDMFNVYIVETMGLSETSAQITSNPLPPAERKVGSPGIAFGNFIKVMNTNNEEVANNEIGEILIKGDNVMKYYFKNPEATNDSITKDGWLRTGDLGLIDDDGYLFITGRLKEIIIKGGENIAPREIDEVLYTHPNIIEASAFACPCDNYGQEVEACVVIDNLKDKEKTIDELLSLCHQALGMFKSPVKIHVTDELPKGPSGKIQRLKLYNMLYQNS